MRRIYADISSLGLNNGDIVHIELLNSVGLPCMTDLFYSLSVQHTLANGVLDIFLMENDKIEMKTYYKLTLPNKFEFTFVLPSSQDISNPAHELLSLLKLACFENIITIRDGKATLDKEYTEKLNLYFTGENPHFNNTEKKLVDLYGYYADNVIEDGVATIDVVEMMDKHLATILPK